MPPIWNHGGPNGALHAAQRRVGHSHPCVDRLSRDPELYRLNAILCGMAERHRAAIRSGAESPFSPHDLAIAADSLDNAERYVRRIAIMLLAGMEITDAAADAYGLPAPARPFTISVGGDSPAESVEFARLKAEHAEMLDQNRQLAAMVEQLTAPPASAPAPEGATPGVEPRPLAKSDPPRRTTRN